MPQALRVIIPPLTNQYLNLTKNSSLAVAIGYPDLVSIFAGTVLNQTGQAVEVIIMTMLVYLTLSLLTSAFMNWFNSRIALQGAMSDGRRRRRFRPPEICRAAAAAVDARRADRLDARQPLLLADEQHRDRPRDRVRGLGDLVHHRLADLRRGL